MSPPDENNDLEDDWASYLPDIGELERNNNNNESPSIDAGVDQEVKIKQTKKPRPKLDEDRLLSENGLPFVRSRIAKKLKFKGKGHEYKDLCRIIEVYQLWGHKLFPKAKFRDFFMITEKLGHTRRLQSQRHDWIDELKGVRSRSISPKPPQNPTTTTTSTTRDISNLVEDVDNLYESLTGDFQRRSNTPPPPPTQEVVNEDEIIALDDDAAWAALGNAVAQDDL